ncbi:MAG TPA: hypothetical protein VFW33_23965, partial [Gemmataceae bacterium]|nr:hypothetical protein [Gemmataceae bacterium]
SKAILQPTDEMTTWDRIWYSPDVTSLVVKGGRTKEGSRINEATRMPEKFTEYFISKIDIKDRSTTPLLTWTRGSIGLICVEWQRNELVTEEKVSEDKNAIRVRRLSDAKVVWEHEFRPGLYVEWARLLPDGQIIAIVQKGKDQVSAGKYSDVRLVYWDVSRKK